MGKGSLGQGIFAARDLWARDLWDKSSLGKESLRKGIFGQGIFGAMDLWARDSSLGVNFQCRLCHGVRTPLCAIGCVNICAHVKEPEVHVRVWYIVETLKRPACTAGCVARLLSQLAFPGESNLNFAWEQFQWDDTVLNKQLLSFVGCDTRQPYTWSKPIRMVTRFAMCPCRRGNICARIRRGSTKGKSSLSSPVYHVNIVPLDRHVGKAPDRNMLPLSFYCSHFSSALESFCPLLERRLLCRRFVH